MAEDAGRRSPGLRGDSGGKNGEKSQKIAPEGLALVGLGGLRWWWCLDGGRRTGEGRGYLYLERLYACILPLLGRAAVKRCCRGSRHP